MVEYTNLFRFSLFVVLYVVAAHIILQPGELHTTRALLMHAQAQSGGDSWGDVTTISEAETFLRSSLPQQLLSLQEVCPRCELAMIQRTASAECVLEPYAVACAATISCAASGASARCGNVSHGGPAASAVDGSGEIDGSRLLIASAVSPFLAGVAIKRGTQVLIIEWHVHLIAAGWSHSSATRRPLSGANRSD